eukprot:10498657-Alexandrium_andersonii.AAC.1
MSGGPAHPPGLEPGAPSSKRPRAASVGAAPSASPTPASTALARPGVDPAQPDEVDSRSGFRQVE